MNKKMGEGSSRQNERAIKDSHLEELDTSILDVSHSICKIVTNTFQGTGFFLKILLDNNKYLYLLMSNEHLIKKEMIEKKENIIVYYRLEKKNIEIKLNEEERYIKCFLDINNIDITVIEILPEDDINKDLFLLPNLDKFEKKELINYQIYIPQYPLNKKFAVSKGIIKNIILNEIIHLSSTELGSSGSPIFLMDTTKVLGKEIQKKKKILEILFIQF